MNNLDKAQKAFLKDEKVTISYYFDDNVPIFVLKPLFLMNFRYIYFFRKFGENHYVNKGLHFLTLKQN